MLIHNDIFSWDNDEIQSVEKRKCMLCMWDLKKRNEKSFVYLKPIFILVSDLKDAKVSVRNCAAQIATKVVSHFKIDPRRMNWIEYYPPIKYLLKNEHIIPERFDSVEFSWRENKAFKPKWKFLSPIIKEKIKEMMLDTKSDFISDRL